jgi:hypothetical protein
VDVVAASKNRLRDFESELVRDLAGLHAFFERNIQSIEGLCSPMPESGWLSTEVTGHPEVFAGVNKNYVSVAVEGTVVMAKDSIDLATLQTVAADNGSDILPMEWDVSRAMHTVLKKSWRSFSYDYELATIQSKLHEVIAHV